MILAITLYKAISIEIVLTVAITLGTTLYQLLREFGLEHILVFVIMSVLAALFDLIDTLRANREICVGMAANMIGVNKSIIVIAAGPFQFAMVNPVITKKSGEYTIEEGCLSLDAVRQCTRYEEIEVDYLNEKFE